MSMLALNFALFTPNLAGIIMRILLSASGKAFVIALTLLITTSVCFGDQTSPELGIRDKTPDAKAFINAKLFVSPTKMFENGVLLIENGKVVDAGQDLTVPQGYTVVDVKGAVIYPGFIESYSDYGIISHGATGKKKYGGPKYTTERIGGNAWNEAINAEVNWSAFYKPDAEKVKEFHANGFTMVQSVRQDGIFRGRSCVSLLGIGLPNDMLVVPYYSHVLSFRKGKSAQDYPSSLMGSIAMIRQMLYDVAWYKQAQTAFKNNPNQEMPEFNSAIEAIAGIEAEPVLFDAGDPAPNILRANSIAQEFGLKPVFVASGREYTHIDDVKNLKASLLVPLKYPETPQINSPEDELDVTLAQLRHWEMAPSNPDFLEDAKISFAITSYGLKKTEDFLPNLRKAVKRGLSKETALASLTTIPAKLCGLKKLAGKLDEGKFANFVVCDGDIFEDDCQIYSVWVAGEKYEISPFPETVFTGEYEITIGNISAKMELTGKTAKQKGELKIGDWSESLKDVSIGRNLISFSCALDSTGKSGKARFSGRKKNDTIMGQCILGDGSKHDWSAVRTGDVKKDEQSTFATDDAPVSDLVSRLTYPNKAFGPVSKPVAQNVLIQNATVWTAEADGVLKTTDILVKEGKFAEIGEGLSASEGTLVIDASGKHVTPGIIDAHSHLAIAGDVNEGTHAITPEVRIGDIINPEQVNMYRQLAGGVTACLSLHGSANPIGGECQFIKLRWGSNAEDMKFTQSPRTIKFALGENVKQSNWGDKFKSRYPQSRLGVEAILRDVFQTAREYERDWKRYNTYGSRKKSLTVAPRKDIGLQTMADVLNSKLIIHCHTYMQAETLMLMRLAEEYGFKIDVFVHVLEGYKVADEMAKHGAGGTTFSDWWAYKFEVYDAIPYNASLMAERGVLTTVKSDDINLARRLNQEAGKVIHYGGTTPEEAIKMVTYNAAVQVGAQDFTGSIAVGKDADFVIWSDYPLSMYAKAEQTWIDGAKYFDIESDKVQRQEIESERNALIQKVLNSTEKGGSK